MSHLPPRPVTTRQEAIDAGAARYFTGEACKYGHVSDRFTVNGGCVECNDVKRRAEQERYQAAKAANAAAGGGS